jgi:hypothetical protein
MVTIQVIWKSTGSPASGIDVTVAIGMLGTVRETTDANGDAHFPDVKPGNYTYYVKSQTLSGRLEGRIVVYI